MGPQILIDSHHFHHTLAKDGQKVYKIYIYILSNNK